MQTDALNLSPLVRDLWADLRDPEELWQIVALILALAIAWGLTRLLRARVRNSPRSDAADMVDHLRNVAGLSDVVFPILTWIILLCVARIAVAIHQHERAGILHVAMALLLAGGIIRLVFYAVRRVFKPSGLLASFERLFSLFVWAIVALHITNLLPEIIDALSSVTVMEHVGNPPRKLTLWEALNGMLWVAVALVGSLWAGAALDAHLSRSDTLDPSLRVALARFSRAALMVLAILVSMALLDIPLGVLSVFGGALGVGLGLGLQRIASNYVSGFIILLDRSLRIGDLITVDKYNGAVTQIKTRYTVIKALDGTEAIIPNEILVSQPVLNQSYTSRQLRVPLKIQIAYESDLEQAMHLMREAASGQPRVLRDPEPYVALTGFGVDGLDLELGIWVGDPELGTGGIKSDINLAILKSFREANISIPYPHRDVRVWLPDGLGEGAKASGKATEEAPEGAPQKSPKPSEAIEKTKNSANLSGLTPSGTESTDK